MATKISNNDEIIDSYDVFNRIEELRNQLADVKNDVSEEAAAMPLDDWVEKIKGDSSHPSRDAIEQLLVLQRLNKDALGYAAGYWRYGGVLIRDNYFEKYARKMAESRSACIRESKWLISCVDWKRAASELKQDYSAVKFNGVTYWIR